MNIIEEILVNAFDQYSRTNKQKASGAKGIKTTNEIKVSIKNNKTIIIENNGDGIDIAKHPTEDIWIPQMIFGELLTSGNYNKQEEKITGGKNGYGAKLTNIYSTKFILETVDKKRKLKYTQVFENNMDVKGEPKIEPYKDKPYTKITFTPDYERFNCEELSDDLCALVKKELTIWSLVLLVKLKFLIMEILLLLMILMIIFHFILDLIHHVFVKQLMNVGVLRLVYQLLMMEVFNKFPLLMVLIPIKEGSTSIILLSKL